MIEYHSKQGTISRIFTWAIVSVLMIGSLQLVDMNANFYHASLLQTPKHAPFDGTVAPIANVPNWVQMGGKNVETYTQLQKLNALVALPYYDPKVLATPTSSLVWGNKEHDKTRIAKITYAVPYMGNYKFDGREYVGGHPAIDFKTAVGTPVRAVMNGYVDKATHHSSGFGVHTVIKHVAVPSYENPNKKETLYSSYSHMKSLNVSEGDIVKKGQIIGYTGNSGTSTTPHLHFQLDRASAPWHPYWPFTWKEARDAGTDFWGAVNMGLGKEKALKYTVNPMKYVQKYYDAKGIKTSETTTKVTEAPKAEADAFNLKFTTQKEYQIDNGKVVIIARLFDDKGKVFGDKFTGVVKLSLKDNDSKLDKTGLTTNSFVKGKAKITLTQLLPGKTQLVAEYGDKKFYSPTFELIPGVEKVEEVVETVETESTEVTETKVEESKEESKTEETFKEAPLPGFFNDVAKNDESYLAIKYLKDEKIISGYSDNTFRPDAPVKRVEALKFITEALLDSNKKVFDPKQLPFSDTEVGVWYSGYVATAYTNGLIKGYPDSTFRPGQDVNRVEFAQMVANAIDAELPGSVKRDPYSDVPNDLWYAPIMSYAKEMNFLDEDKKAIYPGRAMTRRDVAEFIFRVLVVDETNARKYDEKLHSSVRGLRNLL